MAVYRLRRPAEAPWAAAAVVEELVQASRLAALDARAGEGRTW